MTASKPEVVAWMWRDINGDVQFNYMHPNGEPLIRLTDHERLQAEAERLQADHEAAMSSMEPAGSYQKGYDEGRNQGTRHRVADIQQLEAARAADKARIAELENSAASALAVAEGGNQSHNMQVIGRILREALAQQGKENADG